MKYVNNLMRAALFLTALLTVTGLAKALSVPDSGTCNNPGVPCLKITSTGINAAISAVGQGNAAGFSATASSEFAVGGASVGGNGVQGSSSGLNGVQGTCFAAGASGVYGENDAHGYGVAGRVAPIGAGFAIFGDNASTTGWAGAFNGRVQVGAGGFSSGTSVILPSVDASFNIGSAGARFNTIFLLNGSLSGSDIRLKKDIKELSHGLKDVLMLRPVTYRWKSASDNRLQLGLIAQEVEKVIPEVVVHGDNESDPWSMRYDALLPVVIKALQEEHARVTALEQDRTNKSSVLSGGLGEGVAFSLLAIGLVASRIRPKKS